MNAHNSKKILPFHFKQFKVFIIEYFLQKETNLILYNF